MRSCRLLDRKPSRRDSFNMRGSSLCLLLLLVVLAKAYIKSCKYWCKIDNHQYYCCPSGKSGSWSERGWHSLFFPWFWFDVDEHPHVVEHPWHEMMMKWPAKKHCPPLRPHCPRSYEWYRSPELCHSDHECHEWEKCCYDVCLEHKTCKDAE
ncbi:hypothetical protein DMN91_003317 [Ooceraea biroi]|uniref:WAP domain-containing protein n=1 Tax=Ooceraea biroi TaxID=2015173 RepID=A0A3L8DXM5_OOCBI|nr:uncharacterized protein LOC105277007 isoform X1 [Ooceraea biroi]RLU25224.1 hypothetical protein DMN91_003317 [Ooceraea biroi]